MIVQLWWLVFAEAGVPQKIPTNIDWSPNMWLIWAKKAKGWASKQSRQAPLSEKSSNFIQESVAALFGGLARSFFGSN